MSELTRVELEIKNRICENLYLSGQFLDVDNIFKIVKPFGDKHKEYSKNPYSLNDNLKLIIDSKNFNSEQKITILNEISNYFKFYDPTTIEELSENPELCSFIRKIVLKNIENLRKDLISTTQTFQLSKKTGAKTNLIRILNGIYELGLINDQNGQIPTKQNFMCTRR